ncbi:MAG: hypothetical protein HY719_04100 [Planctomycetes bacterium]|nr:hypothetical protein [Planctomycetota bacterium]
MAPARALVVLYASLAAAAAAGVGCASARPPNLREALDFPHPESLKRDQPLPVRVVFERLADQRAKEGPSPFRALLRVAPGVFIAEVPEHPRPDEAAIGDRWRGARLTESGGTAFADYLYAVALPALFARHAQGALFEETEVFNPTGEATPPDRARYVVRGVLRRTSLCTTHLQYGGGFAGSWGFGLLSLPTRVYEAGLAAEFALVDRDIGKVARTVTVDLDGECEWDDFYTENPALKAGADPYMVLMKRLTARTYEHLHRALDDYFASAGPAALTARAPAR